MAKVVASALFSLAAATQQPEYVLTPAGYMRKDCVHSVPSGAQVSKTAAGFVISTDDGDVQLPKCIASNDAPVFQSGKPSKPALRHEQRQLQLPADYDGWLQYAAYQETSVQIGAMINNMTTPTTTPPSDPDMLYLFPALQNIDWIPKVDPEPTAAFDIIQPVLQYPGDNGNYWSVKSWWVTLDEGALASDEIKLTPGEVVGCNMTKIGPQSWFIDAAVPSKNGGKARHTSLTANSLGSRLASQPWAYLTMECYGCTSCSTLPSNNASTIFSDIVLTDTTGAPITPTWLANPKPAKDRTCDSSIEIDGADTVVIYPGTK